MRGGPRLAFSAVAAFAAVVTLTGCGRDRPPAPVTAPPPAAGFTRVIGTGFTIDMPAGWPQPSLNPSDFDKTAAALRAQNPKLAQALDQARSTLGNGSRLFAIDPSDGSSVNLIVVAAGSRSLDTLVTTAVNQLLQVGVTGLHQERTTVGSLTGQRVEFVLPVTGSGGTLTVPETQYYVLRAGRLFILTLFGDNPNLATIADSLRIE